MTHIVVVGAAGRMGREIIEAIEATKDTHLAGTIDLANAEQFETVLAKADVAIDFTAPAASVRNAAVAAACGKAIVIGTTGLDAPQMAAIHVAAKKIPLVYSPNMSIGVNLFWHTAKTLAAQCGAAYTMTIDETHHVHKKDAPSGTAKRLHTLVAQASGRAAASIAVTSHREGEVVGDHSMTFESIGDTMTIRHHAKSRGIFAHGAVHAAQWVVQQPAGYYGMEEVLGL